MKLFVYLFIILSSCFFVFHNQVKALSLSPMSYVYEVNDGESVHGSLRIINSETNTITIKPSALDFGASSEGDGSPVFSEQSEQIMSKWISFEKTEIVLAAGDETFLNFTISVPQDTDPGGYGAAIFIENNNDENIENVSINSKIGSLILLTVIGDDSFQGKIKSFFANQNFYSHLPVEFITEIENTGNNHLFPKGKITISNILGGNREVILLNPENGAILPNSSRRYSSYWQNTEATEDQFEIAKEWKNFGFGPYKATVTTELSEGASTLVSETVVWIIPWQLLFLGIIILVGLVVASRSARKQ